VLSVQHDLQSARDALASVGTESDIASVNAAVGIIADKTASAVHTADDPVWRFAELLPFA